MKLERCFRGGHLLWINCKHQIIDWRQRSKIVLIIVRLVLELVSLSKVKFLVYCEMCECTYNFIQWKNRIRSMTFGFGFCSVLYGGKLQFRFLHIFTFGISSVLCKTWVLVRFIFALFGFFPISRRFDRLSLSLTIVHVTASELVLFCIHCAVYSVRKCLAMYLRWLSGAVKYVLAGGGYVIHFLWLTYSNILYLDVSCTYRIHSFSWYFFVLPHVGCGSCRTAAPCGFWGL